jgi:thiosulfate/3-mercaptopyruvate sulfurtransferase
MYRNCLTGSVIGLGLTVLLGGLVQAATAGSGEIIDAQQLDEALGRGAIVWDVRDAADYAKGHIPGAVNIGDIGKALRDESREDYLSTARIAEVLGAAGIDPGLEVVAYGATGDPYAYFGLMTIRHFGGEQGRVYHGGIDDWKRLGRAVATEPTRRAPVSLSLTVRPGVTLDTPEVVSRVGQPGVQIVDARTPKEYQGQDIRAVRGGHLPGAKNIPYEQNWQDPQSAKKLADKAVEGREGMQLKGTEALKALYAELDPTKETVVYCQSGVRAAQTATVLRQLGFQDVKVYEPSWLGYGNTLDAPAEDVSFINVGQLLGKLNKLQSRLDQMEKQLATLTAKPVAPKGKAEYPAFPRPLPPWPMFPHPVW